MIKDLKTAKIYTVILLILSSISMFSITIRSSRNFNIPAVFSIILWLSISLFLVAYITITIFILLFIQKKDVFKLEFVFIILGLFFSIFSFIASIMLLVKFDKIEKGKIKIKDNKNPIKENEKNIKDFEN